MTDDSSTDGAGGAARRRLRQQGGFTLIELLVAMSLMLVVLGAVLSFLDTTNKLTRKDVEVGTVVTGLQPGFAQMVREVREAVCINNPAGATVNCPGAIAASGKTNPIPCPSSSAGACLSFKRRSASPSDCPDSSGIWTWCHHRIDVRYDCTTGSACVRTVDDRGVRGSRSVIPIRVGDAPLTNGGALAATCSGLPVFMYYARVSGAWTCTTTPTSATRIDIAARVVSRGELSAQAGHTGSVLMQTSAELRNVS